MPEPNRPPWRVDPDIGARPARQLIERGVSVMLDCESCLHIATWGPADIARRFGGHADRSFNWLGPRLRCSHCRSEWVRISPASPAQNADGGRK
jgi:hypothetical protein